MEEDGWAFDYFNYADSYDYESWTKKARTRQSSKETGYATNDTSPFPSPIKNKSAGFFDFDHARPQLPAVVTGPKLRPITKKTSTGAIEIGPDLEEASRRLADQLVKLRLESGDDVGDWNSQEQYQSPITVTKLDQAGFDGIPFRVQTGQTQFVVDQYEIGYRRSLMALGYHQMGPRSQFIQYQNQADLRPSQFQYGQLLMGQNRSQLQYDQRQMDQHKLQCKLARNQNTGGQLAFKLDQRQMGDQRYSVGKFINPRGRQDKAKREQPSNGRAKKGKSRAKTEDHCVFCKNNENPLYTTHTVKNGKGDVICPVLRKMTCPICGATGKKAHTQWHCPTAELKKRRELEQGI